MAERLDSTALDQLFRTARTRKGWSSRLVSEQQLRELYDLLKLAPTSANASPARFVWVRSPEGKERLAARASENNRPKILAAPVTVIIGYDLDFYEQMPKLIPGPGGLSYRERYQSNPEVAQITAFRNSSLQGGYLILAARALGLDCGPMSGFDNAAVDAEFFAGTRVKSNFICSLGYGTDENLRPRNPRLDFEEACRLA
jgi:nitroreductase